MRALQFFLRPWSRKIALRVIFTGLGFATVVWVLGINLADVFYYSARPVYVFFADGWAIALGIIAAFFGGYKLASARDER